MKGHDNISMRLTMLQPGTRAVVTAMYGGRGFNQHLAAMGIFPGAELVLVKGGIGGAVIVDVHDGRFIFGRGMAHRVMVQPLA